MREHENLKVIMVVSTIRFQLCIRMQNMITFCGRKLNRTIPFLRAIVETQWFTVRLPPPHSDVQLTKNSLILFLFLFAVSRLMSGSPASSSMNMGNMSMSAALSSCDVKPMQFPLAQRRKRRVLFTQAQVSLAPLMSSNLFLKLE